MKEEMEFADEHLAFFIYLALSAMLIVACCVGYGIHFVNQKVKNDSSIAVDTKRIADALEILSKKP